MKSDAIHELKMYHYNQIKEQLQELVQHKQRIIEKQSQELDQVQQDFISFKLFSQFQSQCSQQTVADIQEQLRLAEQFDCNVFSQQCNQIDTQQNKMNQQFQQLDRVKELINKKAQIQTQILESQKYIQLMKLQNQSIKETNIQKTNYKSTLQFNILQHNKSIKATHQDIKDIDNQKRYWNNVLQDAKGSIRVYCRIRPNDEDITDIIQVSGECSICMKVPEKLLKSGNYQKENNFNFEHIFLSDSDQEDVYKELSDLVQNVVDGHNVCIFAYGQTGSGKTYTMQGSENNLQRGVIPRAVEQIFKEVEQMQLLGWNIEIRVGFQEIYNETIKDMISNQRSEDIKMFEVKDVPQVAQLFQKAKENRQVAETLSNECSSRSHFIFQLNLSGNCNEKQINATLNLVDLAGSERANIAKTEGDRFTETKNINKSLSALGDVFNALYNKNTFVPYRNSKLTFVLQKYLEGTSKTLMMVNISSKADDFPQTLASLRFAEKVKSCKMQIQQNQTNNNKK